MTSAERGFLRRECERLSAAGWTTVSSYWVAKNMLALISEVERLTEERNRFAVHIARMSL